MKKSYHLTDHEKGKIIAFKAVGWFNLKIAKHLLRQYSTISNFFSNQNNPGQKKKPEPRKIKIQRKDRKRTTVAKIKSGLKFNLS